MPTSKSLVRHPRFFNPIVARPSTIDPAKLTALAILWGTSSVMGTDHVVMAASDWKRAERAGAILS